MSERNHRWRNTKAPGQTCFVTATCLDFAHLFSRSEMRTRMAIHLLSDCIRYDARLLSFVVMTHHVHFLVSPNETQTISQLLQQIKRRSAKELRQYLTSSELNQLIQQKGLNDHRFWKDGFRGNPIYSESVALQKRHYIHQNPVRSGFVDDPAAYQWSSLHLAENNLMDADEGVDLGKVIDFYQGLLESGI